MWDLGHKYCVDFALDALRPSVSFTIALAFDRSFVLRNGDFLVSTLLDRFLQAELVGALETTSSLSTADEESSERAIEAAKLSLKYLFDDIDVFGFAPPEAYTPAASFRPDGLEPDGLEEVDGFRSRSGFSDAVRNDFGVLFTILNVYYKIYRDEVRDDDQLAIDIALSLEAAVSPLWSGVDESGKIAKLLDLADATEVFRRLGGFIALVQGILRPLVAPAKEDADRAERRRRATFVIRRVVEHLRCHKMFYTAEYLRHVTDITRGAALRQFVDMAVSGHVALGAQQQASLRALFDVGNSFLNGCEVVVPARDAWHGRDARAATGALDHPGGAGVRFGVLSSHEVILPSDGAHFEAITGQCVLDDAPSPVRPGPLEIKVVTPLDE